MKKFLKSVLNLPKSILNFLIGTVAELKQVEWIKGSKVFRYTLFVFLFLFFGALAIILIDQAFLSIRSLIIKA